MENNIENLNKEISCSRIFDYLTNENDEQKQCYIEALGYNKKEPFSGIFRLRCVFSKLLKEFRDEFEIKSFLAVNFYELLDQYGVTEATECDYTNLDVLYIDDAGTAFTKTIPRRDLEKYRNYLKKLYQCFQKRYERLGYDSGGLLFYYLYMLKDNLILYMDIDKLLQENTNISLEDILTLCLYTKDQNKFNQYFNALKKCPIKYKEMLLEYVKPASMYLYEENQNFRNYYFSLYHIAKENEAAMEISILKYIKHEIKEMDISNKNFAFNEKAYYGHEFEDFFGDKVQVFLRLLKENRISDAEELLNLKKLFLTNALVSKTYENKNTICTSYSVPTGDSDREAAAGIYEERIEYRFDEKITMHAIHPKKEIEVIKRLFDHYEENILESGDKRERIRLLNFFKEELKCDIENSYQKVKK